MSATAAITNGSQVAASVVVSHTAAASMVPLKKLPADPLMLIAPRNAARNVPDPAGTALASATPSRYNVLPSIAYTPAVIVGALLT